MPAQNASAMSHKIFSHSFPHSYFHPLSIYHVPNIRPFLGARIVKLNMIQLLLGETQGPLGETLIPYKVMKTLIKGRTQKKKCMQ